MTPHIRFISSSLFLQSINRDDSSRALIHATSHSLQCMLIYFPPYHNFNYIKDNTSSNLSFTLISGQLHLVILQDSQQLHYTLLPGDILFLPRNLYRRTYTTNLPALFVENIDGGHLPHLRQLINE